MVRMTKASRVPPVSPVFIVVFHKALRGLLPIFFLKFV